MMTILSVIALAVAVSNPAASFSYGAREFISARPPLVILVGVDGFRWDYLDRYAHAAPNLLRTAEDGVRVRRLIPVFPSNTFPNLYSIVTGLRPARHGIVNNAMRDPLLDASFSMRDQSALTDGRWWGGEPIWVTAERQGISSATMFWVGSEAEIRGWRPSRWMSYDVRMPNTARVDTVLGWLDRPPAPSLVLLYFSDVDRAGHAFGPEAQEVGLALAEVDSSIGRLLAGLEARGLADDVYLLIVADHGMAAQVQSAAHTIFLSDYADMSHVTASSGASVAIYPRSTDPDTAEWQVTYVEEALRGVHPALRTYRKYELASDFSPKSERRWPPLMAVADEGWTIRAGTRSKYAPEDSTRVLGGHGYMPHVESMHGTFVARGPGFRSGVLLENMEVVDIHGIIARILDLEPAPNDGSEVPGLWSNDSPESRR